MRLESSAICTSGEPVSVSCKRCSLMVSCLTISADAMGSTLSIGGHAGHRVVRRHRVEAGAATDRARLRAPEPDHHPSVRSAAVSATIEVTGVTKSFGELLAL